MSDALVLTDAASLPQGPSWAEGGEALEWFFLVRMLGWSATAADRDGDRALAGHGVVIVAGDPGELPTRRLEELRRAAEMRAMLVVAPPATGEWARFAGTERTGEAHPEAGTLAWHGPGPSAAWTPTEAAPLTPFEAGGAERWSTAAGRPAVAARTLPSGSVIATIGVAATGVRKRLLTCGAPFPTAWLDLDRCVILRVDDPGASANVHLRSWSYAKLGEEEWAAVSAALRERGARLSVAYTPGFADDGDPERGALELAGRPVLERRVSVHPSPLVRHTDLRGSAPGRVNDYEAEYRGISRLVAEGLAGVEMHGYTHLAGDLDEWAKAPDRYEAVSWYREFDAGEQPPAGCSLPGHPVQLGAALLREHFADSPAALVCPGQAWTDLVVEQALYARLRLVSAEGLAVRDGDRFCWSGVVPTVYLDKPDAALFEAELPVTGLFHDLELATGGVEWLTWHLDGWRRAGARRFIDLRELAAALELRLQLRPSARGWRLDTGSPAAAPALSLPRPLPVLVHAPTPGLPPELELVGGHRTGVQRLAGGLGRLVLPPGA